MNAHEIQVLLKLAQDARCAKIKVGDFEAVFFPPELPASEYEPGSLKDPLASATTEDDVRLWHVGGAGYQDTKGNEIIPPLTGEQDGD